ncbi:MAG: hypothetical protein JWO09_3173 [Bacteroidetes bacterium]|nr:hypothetical protein [Bacteroidota bacterium]
MKKLIIAAVVLVVMTVKAVAGPVVTFHCEIGRKSLDCSKFGFCDWGINVDFKAASNATVQLIENANSLKIDLTKDAIIGKEEFFKGNTVVFEEDFVVPVNIQKALGAKSTITIKAGTYKLIKTQTGFQINISLN